MPQNVVKIQTGFSEKTSENFNSTQHSISLEMDCVINGTTHEIESSSQKLFALCRKIVSAQKSVNVDSLLNNDNPPVNHSQNTQPPQSNAQNANGNNQSPPRPATQKQIKFLLELAKNANLSHDEILKLPAVYKKDRFEQLTAYEASALIDRYNNKKMAA